MYGIPFFGYFGKFRKNSLTYFFVCDIMDNALLW